MKRKTRKRPESDILIVQLLGGMDKQRKMLEKSIFSMCNDKNIDVIVRFVETAHLSQNFDSLDWAVKKTNDDVGDIPIFESIIKLQRAMLRSKCCPFCRLKLWFKTGI